MGGSTVPSTPRTEVLAWGCGDVRGFVGDMWAEYVRDVHEGRRARGHRGRVFSQVVFGDVFFIFSINVHTININL